MTTYLTQSALVLVRPDRPYELATDQPLADASDGKTLTLTIGAERHTLPATAAEAFVAKRVSGRHTLQGVRVTRKCVMKCEGAPDVTVEAGEYYIVDKVIP